MSWVLVVGAGWVLLAVVTAVLIGRSVRLADMKAEAAADAAGQEPNFVVDLPPLHAVDRSDDLGDTADTPSPQVRETPTIPGIPAARPKLVKPPVPQSNPKSARRSGLG